MIRKSLAIIPAIAVLILAGFGLKGMFSKATLQPTAHAAVAAEPVAQGCSAVAVTNITNQNVGLSLGEKVTVNWTFNPTGVTNPCVSVEGFKVKIEVTRRTGRKADRTIDLPANARSTEATFTEAGDKIKTINAVVTAKLSGAATGSKTENSDN